MTPNSPFEINWPLKLMEDQKTKRIKMDIMFEITHEIVIGIMMVAFAGSQTRTTSGFEGLFQTEGKGRQWLLSYILKILIRDQYLKFSFAHHSFYEQTTLHIVIYFKWSSWKSLINTYSNNSKLKIFQVTLDLESPIWHCSSDRLC